MAKSAYQRPRGTYDIVPPDYEVWRWLIENFESNCLNAGYGRISTPVFESEQLFSRSVGDDTEVVAKEMYTFEDRSGNRLSLRPEGTAGIVRAYVENGLSSRPKPVKLYKIEPMFRYDRPQAGRYREFWQAGIEVFGSAEPLIDAQAIALAARFLRQIGIEFSLQINSIGSPNARKGYITKLQDYFQPHVQKLPELAQQQLEKNPLRILDSKDKSIQRLIEDAPQIIDHLDKASAQHFQQVLEYLDQFGIEYDLNTRLVRGLDYYTGTLFEFWGSHQGMQNAIGGGGRYDSLVEQLGGRPTPAVGFDIGLERLITELHKKTSQIPVVSKQVYLVSIGDEAKAQAFLVEQQLLDVGISTVCELTRKNLADQLARAAKLQVEYALIIGKKELIDQTIIIKEMASGNQEVMPSAKIAGELARRFHNS